MTKKPLFIVFDGLDGSGKSTQINRLAAALRAEGRDVVITAEPTDYETGRTLRQALRGEKTATPTELAALFLLDRIAHNVHPQTGIEAMLAQGKTVLCDRYYYSSMAYQGGQTDFEWVTRQNVDCPDIRHPDGCLLFDMSPEECMARIQKGRDSTEIYETVEAQTRCRAMFARVTERLKDVDAIYTIQAGHSEDAVFEQVLGAVRAMECAKED